MINRPVRVLLLVFLGFVTLVGPARAQLEANLSNMTDENSEGYLLPLRTGLSGTLNSAIFRTGDVPLEGFTFTIGLKVMSVGFDDEDRTFEPVDPAGFTSTGQISASTVIGDTEATYIPGQGGTTFISPGGFDLENFTLAVPQLTIGNALGTRAVIRYVAIDAGEADLGDISLFGIGAQHSLSQYFPDLPVNLAAGIFYQTFNIVDIVKLGTTQLNVTASKHYQKYFEPYLGVGLDTFDMEAEYTYDSSGEEEPVKIEFDRQTNMRLTFGMGFNFPGIKLQAEYNIAAESGGAIGLCFGN